MDRRGGSVPRLESLSWFDPDPDPVPDPATVPGLAPDWNYRHISDDVLPALRAAGGLDARIDQMLVANPRRYFVG